MLALERDGLTEEEFGNLKKLIADNVDVLALDTSELGHTDLVRHKVDTSDSPPIKANMQSTICVPRQNCLGNGEFGGNMTFLKCLVQPCGTCSKEGWKLPILY